MKLSRRRFIFNSGTLLAGSALGCSSWLDIIQSKKNVLYPQQKQALQDFFSVVKTPQEIIDFGKEYLSLRPQEANIDFLVANLSGFYSEHAPLSLPAALSDVNRLIEGDFAAGKILPVNGWFLAVSEARFCAFALMSKKENYS